MKKQLFILTLSFLALLSCSSGDDEQSSSNELLMKTWNLVRDEDERGSFQIVCANNGHRDYVEFISPNIANFYYVYRSTYINGNWICSDEYASEPHTFIKSENEISLYFYGNLVDIWTITKLNGLSLEITTNNGFKKEYSVN